MLTQLDIIFAVFESEGHSLKFKVTKGKCC